jgi:hypothetical protein
VKGAGGTCLQLSAPMVAATKKNSNAIGV